MKIKILSDDVINKIAAGEVIERPAAVVRELVDNALDAGADDISIYIESGGCEQIRVVDNGYGMERQDAEAAFQRHATSKISEASELFFVSTLGFRGEALSSIAAVSRVKLITKTADCQAGTQIIIHAGIVKGVSAVAAPVGSDFEVSALFYNVPARKKFLKQPATEELRVRQWLQQSALAWPAVKFRLVADGKEILSLPRKKTSVERGAAMQKAPTVSFQRQAGDMIISGVLAHPGTVQGAGNSFTILVNKRPVSDRMILRAVKDGFGGVLKEREMPAGFVRIDLPPQAVDVNVHPQKSEVRFRASSEVFTCVRHAVQQALKEFTAPVEFGQMSGSAISVEGGQALGLETRRVQGNHYAGAHNLGLFFEQNPPAVSSTETSKPQFRFAELAYIGQAFACYLFCELGEMLYVVDMHAAHERYNYNLIRNAISAKEVQSQRSLLPLTVEVGEEAVLELPSAQAVFESLGFEVEAFAKDAVIVRAVPALLVNKDISAIVRELMCNLEQGLETKGIGVQLDQIAARIACHASIRSGYDMKREEVYALFESLDRAEFSAACPHGRPVIISLRKDEIERWFGRDR